MFVRSTLIGVALAIALLTRSPSAIPAGSNGSVPCSQQKVIGCVLTILDGVEVYFNGWNPSADQGAYEFGYKWQCVELVQRYYYLKHNYPKIWAPLYAYQAFDDWGHPATMMAFPNGSPTTPRRGDVLIFGPVPGNPYGHMALVKSVGNGRITFVQENMYDVGEDSLPINSKNYVQNLGLYGAVRGWLRDTTGHPAALVNPSLVHEETFRLRNDWSVQFKVTGNADYRLELDGQAILSGRTNQASQWMSLAAGDHTVKLYADPSSDVHVFWGVQAVPVLMLLPDPH